MDGSRFDVWTRRRFGQVAAGCVVALRGLTAGQAAGAKNRKKKRKKRCKPVTESCTPGGKRKCCKTLTCGSLFEVPGHRCCRGKGAPCSSGAECCLDHSCVIEVGSAQGVCGL